MYYQKFKLFQLMKRLLGLPPFAPRYTQIYSKICELKATKLLEIGTNDGRNAQRMIEVAKQNNESPIEYYGFDLFECQDDKDFFSEFSIRSRTSKEVGNYLKKNGVPQPFLVAGDSTKELPKHVRALPPMDIIFIDGGHSYATVLNDWSNVQPLITDKTVIFFDDYPHWGIGTVVDQIDRSQWDVKVLPITDYFKVRKEFREDPEKKVIGFQLAMVQKKQGSNERNQHVS